MNIVEDLLGKEVIDDSGNLVGIVKDVAWNYEMNSVESLVVEKGGGGILSFGSGERKFVSYDSIHSIGDKVLINIRITQTKKEEEEESGSDRFGLSDRLGGLGL